MKSGNYDENDIVMSVTMTPGGGGRTRPLSPYRSMSRAEHEALTSDPWTCEECRWSTLGEPRRCGHRWVQMLDGSRAYLPRPDVHRAVRRNEYRHPAVSEAQPLTSDDVQALCRVLAMLDRWDKEDVAAGRDAPEA